MHCINCGEELIKYGVCPKCRKYMLPWPPGQQNGNANNINSQNYMNYNQQQYPATASQQYPMVPARPQYPMVPVRQQYPMVPVRPQYPMPPAQANRRQYPVIQSSMVRCHKCKSVIANDVEICPFCGVVTWYGNKCKKYNRDLMFDRAKTIKKAFLHLFLGMLLWSIAKSAGIGGEASGELPPELFIFFPAGWAVVGRWVNVYLVGSCLMFIIGLLIDLFIGAAVGMIILPLEFIVGLCELIGNKKIM